MKATIIVPVFNTEAYLPACLDSLRHQTRQDFDIVVVDDCSEGDAKGIIESFELPDVSVDYFRHASNRGILETRFTGIRRAQGDYVGFLDSDDIAKPDFVERLLGAAERTGADIVGSALPRGDEGAHFTLSGTDEVLGAYADRRICNLIVWTKFYRRALVSSLNNSIVGGARIGACEDVVFNVFCALKHPTYVHIPEVLVEHTHRRPGSAWNAASYEKRQEALRDTIYAFEVLSEAASGYEDSISTIIEITSRYAYKKLLLPPDREFLDWALIHIRSSPMGRLVLSAMFAEAARLQFGDRDRIAQLERELASKEEALASKKEKLASKQEQLNRTREHLSQARQRRQRLRSILGDLWRWSLSGLPGRS